MEASIMGDMIVRVNTWDLLWVLHGGEIVAQYTMLALPIRMSWQKKETEL